MAKEIPLACAIAEKMLRALAEGKLVPPEIMSDRYVFYRVPEYLQAHIDFTPRPDEIPLLPYERSKCYNHLPQARIWVHKTGHMYCIANLAKGVPAILNGELWFSRKDLMKCILDSNSDNQLAMELKASLTTREREILILIASGINNSQIAENLNISRNTVKTHLYNIYNKIKVPNRLQAALWAAKNL